MRRDMTATHGPYVSTRHGIVVVRSPQGLREDKVQGADRKHRLAVVVNPTGSVILHITELVQEGLCPLMVCEWGKLSSRWGWWQIYWRSIGWERKSSSAVILSFILRKPIRVHLV